MNNVEQECVVCMGVGWVCENHIGKPWGEMKNIPNVSCDCGAGEPCHSCQDLVYRLEAKDTNCG